MAIFRTIFFDIVGRCNASCSYCLTGSRKLKQGAAIDIALFSETLTKLQKQQAVDNNTVVALYNWGEPLLHPDLEGIVAVLNSLGLSYGLSTNASLRLKVSRELVRNLDHVIISMPGFSQKSYDRISKLNFERVRENTRKMASELRTLGFRQGMSIAYHVYQFNIEEMGECERFATRQRINFRPYYAMMNDWWALQGWLTGTLPNESMRRISEDIFCANVRQTMRNAPKGYSCRQHEYLVIDEAANVVGCCQLPKDHPKFLCGNIIEEDMETVLARRACLPVCRDCVESGLAYYFNDSFTPPEFYRSDCVRIQSRRLYALLHCHVPALLTRMSAWVH